MNYAIHAHDLQSQLTIMKKQGRSLTIGEDLEEEDSIESLLKRAQKASRSITLSMQGSGAMAGSRDKGRADREDAFKKAEDVLSEFDTLMKDLD